jgi:cell division protein ZapA
MSEKIKNIKINILGNTYTIKTDSDEEYINKLVKFINRKKDEIFGKDYQISNLKEIIMLLLNVADELFKLKETIELKADEITDKIEKTLKENYIDS